MLTTRFSPFFHYADIFPICRHFSIHGLNSPPAPLAPTSPILNGEESHPLPSCDIDSVKYEKSGWICKCDEDAFLADLRIHTNFSPFSSITVTNRLVLELKIRYIDTVSFISPCMHFSIIAFTTDIAFNLIVIFSKIHLINLIFINRLIIARITPIFTKIFVEIKQITIAVYLQSQAATR